MANETTELKKSCVRERGKNPHPGRDSRSALRRAAIVACLRAHPTLGAGMQAAGVAWPTIGSMMLCPDFRAAVRAIRDEQRERRRMRGIAEPPSAQQGVL